MKQSKDHYIPEFYLKRWSQNNPDKKLLSGRYFPEKNIIQWTPRAPSGTCYERDLYGEIEEAFFKPLDNDACDILTRLESEDIISPIQLDIGEKDHNNWAIFIIGFIIRVPDKIESIQEKFKNASLDKSIARNQIPQIIESERAVKDLRSLTWIFARVESNLELITCDNPLIFKPRNLSDPDCVIILPLSPKHFFLATSQQNTSRLVNNPRKIASSINTEIIKNAKIRIFTKNKNSIKDSFLIKHWSKKNGT